jgi:hypothetical protein
LKTILGIVGNGGIGVMAGFLTRPCCVLPVALSLGGISGVGVGEQFSAHRASFISLGGAMLAASLLIAFRRPGGWPIKIATAGATLVAFAWSMGSF